MKKFLIYILLIAIASSAQAEFKVATKKKSKIKSFTQNEIDKAIAQSKKPKKKITKKKKTRGIASVDKVGVNEQIAALEARPEKTKKDYIAIAELYVKLKNYNKAIATLKLANKPQAIEVLDFLSRIYNTIGDTQEEIRALELIKIDGKATPGQYTRLGDAYRKIGKVVEAIPVYRESIFKAPKYEKAYQGLFEVYLGQKNFYDARLVIIEVMEKFGDKKYWLNEFCKIEVDQNYHDNAKQVCQKAIMKDPKNADNHVNLAVAFKNTENEDQARKILFKAAKQFKKSEITQWNAGQMSCAIKNWEQASEQFKACIKSDANSGRCYLGWGKAQFELKKYDKALEYLNKSCPYIKGADVEIRRLSYELDKIKDTKNSKKYISATDNCSTDWFNYAKKNKEAQVYKINMDRCFFP